MRTIQTIFVAEMKQLLRTGKSSLYLAILLLFSISIAIVGLMRYQSMAGFMQKKVAQYEERLKKGAPEGVANLVQQGYHCVNMPHPLFLMAGSRRIESPREYTFSPIHAFYAVQTAGWTGPKMDGGFNQFPVFEMKEMNLDASSFIDFDLTFIVQVFLSFLMILLGFDMVSKDRREGRLRLTFSCAGHRLHVWIGKWLTLMVVGTIGFLLVTSFFTVLLLMVFPSCATLSFLKTLLIFGALSLGYLSFWSVVVLWVSALSEYDARSLTVLIALWLLSVVAIPCSAKLWTKVKPIESIENVMRHQEQQILIAKETKSKEGLIFDYDVSWNSRSPALLQAKEQSKFINAMGIAFEQGALAYDKKCLDQLAVAERFSHLSPAMLYRSIAENLCGNGLGSFYRFNKNASDYNRAINTFLLEADGRDPQSKHGIYFKFPGFASKKPIAYESIPKFCSPAIDSFQFLPWSQLLGAILLTIFAAFLSLATFIRLHV